MYAGRDTNDQDDYVFIACNSHWEEHDISLPNLGENYLWQVIVNTYDEHSITVYRQEVYAYDNVIKLPPRTVQILMAKNKLKSC
jgi:glycogen operon protein